MLALVRRPANDADVLTARILVEISNERAATLARYRAGEFPPEIALGCYYSEWAYESNGNPRRTGCGSGNKRTVIRNLSVQISAYRNVAAQIYRRAHWLESPCARPQTPEPSDERRSALDENQQTTKLYLSAMLDYVRCMHVKLEHAQSTNAAREEVSQLAADRAAAMEEMLRERRRYEERWDDPLPVLVGD